jgi:hypothetical protein
MIKLRKGTLIVLETSRKWKILESARDWIRTNPRYQLFIASVCQICDAKSKRAGVCAGFTYFFSVSTCLDKYKKIE